MSTLSPLSNSISPRNVALDSDNRDFALSDAPVFQGSCDSIVGSFARSPAVDIGSVAIVVDSHSFAPSVVPVPQCSFSSSSGCSAPLPPEISSQGLSSLDIILRMFAIIDLSGTHTHCAETPGLLIGMSSNVFSKLIVPLLALLCVHNSSLLSCRVASWNSHGLICKSIYEKI